MIKKVIKKSTILIEFAKKIRLRRYELGLTQEQLAEAANFQNQARHHPSQPQPRKSKEAPEAEGIPIHGTRGLSLGQHIRSSSH